MYAIRVRAMGNKHIQPKAGFARPSATLRINNRGRRVLTRPDENDRRANLAPAPPAVPASLLTPADRAELDRRYAKRIAVQAAQRAASRPAEGGDPRGV